MSKINTVDKLLQFANPSNSDVIAISSQDDLELETFQDFMEFAKSRRKFTRHDIRDCSHSRRAQAWLGQGLRYKVIKEIEYHMYEYNQDILNSYEEFKSWLQHVTRFSLDDVPALARYSWILRARREGIVKACDSLGWQTFSRC